MLPHPHLPAIASLEDHRKTSQQLIARYVGFSSTASSAASADEDAASAAWKAAARKSHMASAARVRNEVQRAKDKARPAASRVTRQRQRPGGEPRSSQAVSAPALLESYTHIFSSRLRRRKCVLWCVCACSASDVCKW